ncbi:hypothetical protein DEU56DRAFT_918909 [Suillus clintonianus]|uniref:uncharacterized protein n=1 Tax=Suillus clintonianus TaxID=1904413 RepID=UPI001B869750|nr:uncharacterized protein DEU56DRAFT_918909 [Suillus clintonianus]KAG2118295.1 hypothetical protein DEU56DRAFT_918909 [Suillus clintonianus]
MRLLLCTIIYLVAVVQAVVPTTNATATSDSPEAPSFTNRTLWNIIFTSVLTLFSCIYGAIHPNIPSPKDSPFRILWRRLGIIIMALIFPDLIATWAMRQWISACRVTKQFKESGYFNVPQLQGKSENYEFKLAEAPAEQLEHELDILPCVLNTLPHRSLASQEHDRARLSVAPAEVSTSRYRALTKPFKRLFKAYISDQSEDYAWTQTHSFFVLMGGFMLYLDGEPHHTLDPDEVLKLIREGCIDAPTLTAKQIRDRSKGNIILKGLIILQVAWFILQLISRAIYHLETTQLETVTLAFAVLNFLTYAVWWNKPLDVQCPHPVYWKSTESKPWGRVAVLISGGDEHNVLTAIWFAVMDSISELMTGDEIPTHKLRVSTFDGSIKSDNWIHRFAGIPLVTTFGGIHCMAWFSAFPTYQEQVLWRTSAVAITCIPCLECLLISVGEMIAIDDFDGGVMDLIGFLVIFLLAMLYIAGRAILLVLTVTTLRNLPPDAYMAVSWIS